MCARLQRLRLEPGEQTTGTRSSVIARRLYRRGDPSRYQRLRSWIASGRAALAVAMTVP